MCVFVYGPTDSLGYLLAKSSNRPPTFYWFSWKHKNHMTTVFASWTSQTCHWPWIVKILTNCLIVLAWFPFEYWYLHFQNSHFVTICEAWLFEITHFHRQNVFISIAKLILNSKELKEGHCCWSKCQNLSHHGMQIIVIFENEGTCVCQSLVGTILWIMLSCFVVMLTDMLAYSEMQMELIYCL